MNIKTFLRCAALSFVCLTLSVLPSCGDSAGEIHSAGSTETVTKQTPETETASAEQLSDAPELDLDAVREHRKIPLWQEDNIPYAIENGGRDATIQTYLVEGADAGVVIFPGGGYFQLSEDSEGTAVAEAYNEQGYSAFVVCYRYEPYDGRATLADGQRAIQYVRYHAAEFGMDPDKIAVCGFSAGGHLSVMTAQHAPEENYAGDGIGAVSSYPNACILAYPVTTLGNGTFETMPRIFLGDKMNDETAVSEYSYPAHLDRMPPTFVFYSEKDSLVNYQKNSVEFSDAMRAAGKTVVCTGYPDGEHGIGLGTSFKSFSAWLTDSVKFLSDNGL